MPRLTILFGCLLCGLSGFTACMLPEFKLGTWLIPAGFGIGLAAKKHAMHTGALIGTIGAALCLVRGITQIIKMMGADSGPVNTLAFGMIWAMAIICLTYVGLCVQSFIAARKAREANENRA
jgi:hypothetical protein